ncbi:hypothetical protein LSCM1_02795 [Leishmania martiniquensis]|uniref:Peptidase C51 domain-containing protein n=1 Tax=Leishmania martiniquensis TaxID=1580590 RepID=A0A836H362_9TRYP|nr:hypothetical protein LSCM1_02795 [Leishmania martiniquensis]
MRHRRPSSSAANAPDGAAAPTHLRPSSSSSPPPSLPLPAHNEVLFAEQRASDPSDAEMCDAYAMRLLNQAKDEERCSGPYWRVRCSRSILVGLLIWATIGLVVYMKLDGTDFGSEVGPATSDADTNLSLLPGGCRGELCRQDGGDGPFGAVLGAHNGVTAYSNCHSVTCISFLEHKIPIPLRPGAWTALRTPHAKTRLMKTGMKWQCVEYARRYWMLRGTPAPATFGSVHGAADIWGALDFVTLLDSATKLPLLKFRNGAKVGDGGSRPRVGDLIIYPRDNNRSLPFGHVAVVVGVEMPSKLDAGDAYRDAVTSASASQSRRRHGLVYIAEQNWDSSPWPDPYRNYSRSLPLEVRESADGRPLQYTIQDSFCGIQGWVRYDDVP